MTYFLYHDDISSEVDFGDVIAIDTETMGLNINRDRLCLIQLSSGDGIAHLVQISKKSLDKQENFPNLKKFLKIQIQQNFFILQDLIWLLLKKISVN